MEANNAKDWSSQCPEECQDREPEARSGSLGTISRPGPQLGTNKVRTSGEDSNEPNIFISGQWSPKTIPGKIVGQLIQETQKQLAYHEQQAELLRERLQELKGIPIDHKE